MFWKVSRKPKNNVSSCGFEGDVPNWSLKTVASVVSSLMSCPSTMFITTGWLVICHGLPWYVSGVVRALYLQPKKQLNIKRNFAGVWLVYIVLLLMEEILHHLQGFMHLRWCRISSINSSFCTYSAKIYRTPIRWPILKQVENPNQTSGGTKVFSAVGIFPQVHLGVLEWDPFWEKIEQ